MSKNNNNSSSILGDLIKHSSPRQKASDDAIELFDGKPPEMGTEEDWLRGQAEFSRRFNEANLEIWPDKGESSDLPSSVMKIFFDMADSQKNWNKKDK